MNFGQNLKHTKKLSLLSLLVMSVLVVQGLLGLALLWVKSGMTFEGLISYYSPINGPAKSIDGIIEIYWQHIFSMALVGFLFGHFLPFIEAISERLRRILFYTFIFAPVVFVASPFLALFIHRYISIFAFLSMTVFLAAMLVEIYFVLITLTASSSKSM